ncbi:hypothetical protein DB30_04015 [Enhygromyxa salina]|uniref:Uncharacterized protein n=1 Tax=Enhygromyxa salina TaxID=215803 RepID=A0A0C2A0F6_9BACT|nr:hypothetical protein [Enhygromyxa salina]KIG16853.1 hypothetical protein DB30_04015 [Enhygromyxa salina]
MNDNRSLTLRDGLVSLFHDDPRLAFELCARAGGPTIGPKLKIRSERTDFVDPSDPSLTHRTDIVFVAYTKRAGRRVAVAGLALEILVSVDPARPPGWDVYPEGIQRRHGCPGQVVIISPDPAVRAWAHVQQLARAELGRTTLLRS